ncbi:MAG: hypothetical protein HOM68_29555 [Gemmatimonadetes bacterium]|nr:hypothetical protein [Gemmatimonadota bacterium]MBT4608984.1 hypothetical protein [Gemmatimonadota bacterium]MBT5060728.1 hypothetical protein [Gemmatimonadota bacterium]MBT5145363.1 hypothetical protein [Gemmatimonadota bacterium]MBT5591551.1 hypothetical protein [Gemmatimonadota bacterium]
MTYPPSAHFRAERLLDAPIIHAGLPGLEGERGFNINGPSLVRVPVGAPGRLGRYYLYFAHHGGHYIRMAWADELRGPWTVLPEPGVLHMDDGPGINHIASPDVHIGDDGQWRMYFHMPVDQRGQRTFVALSRDGLQWEVREPELGWFYCRAFSYSDAWFSFTKDTNVGGLLGRSTDGLEPFEEGAAVAPSSRHAATWVNGDTLHLFYSRAEDTPECILVAQVDLRQPWRQWTDSSGELLLKPERIWEGACLPRQVSRWGRSKVPVHQLRDPAIYVEHDELYLLYSGAGETNIGIARLHRL